MIKVACKDDLDGKAVCRVGTTMDATHPDEHPWIM